MKLLGHASDKVTIELTLHELHLANLLIQEGRISHECDAWPMESSVIPP